MAPVSLRVSPSVRAQKPFNVGTVPGAGARLCLHFRFVLANEKRWIISVWQEINTTFGVYKD